VLDPHVVFVGAAIGLSGTLLYARDTLRGVTQPNRVTWLMWFIAPMLAFSDEIRQGVGLQSVMTFVIGIGPLIVLLASFANPNSVWKIGPFDVACGLASIAGLIIWLVTSNDTVALASFMAADALAGLPTLVKSYRAPETESVNTYLTSLINAALTLATVTVWTSAEIAFPIQILVFNAVLIALIAGRLGPRLRHEPRPAPIAPLERVISPIRGGEER
jgi:hypothetical protein